MCEISQSCLDTIGSDQLSALIFSEQGAIARRENRLCGAGQIVLGMPQPQSGGQRFHSNVRLHSPFLFPSFPLYYPMLLFSWHTPVFLSQALLLTFSLSISCSSSRCSSFLLLNFFRLLFGSPPRNPHLPLFPSRPYLISAFYSHLLSFLFDSSLPSFSVG